MQLTERGVQHGGHRSQSLSLRANLICGSGRLGRTLFRLKTGRLPRPDGRRDPARRRGVLGGITGLGDTCVFLRQRTYGGKVMLGSILLLCVLRPTMPPSTRIRPNARDHARCLIASGSNTVMEISPDRVEGFQNRAITPT